MARHDIEMFANGLVCTNARGRNRSHHLQDVVLDAMKASDFGTAVGCDG